MTKVHMPADLEPRSSTGLRRTPFYLESQGDWLFGWVHERESLCRYQRGVIICPPLGYEQVHAHRSLRHLADALAQAGFPVLRFDYHGTGDSTGVDEDADRIATWLANLRSAINWMRSELGCAEISVVGLRLGASLAAQVAADEPMTDLVLWAPVVQGRTYVRAMKFLSKTAGPTVHRSKDIEAAGFVIAEQTAHDLAGIDIMQVRPRCPRVLLVDRDDLPTDTQLRDHLSELGIETRQTVQPGYAKMMAEPHHTQVPQQAIAEIVSWLCSREVDTKAKLSAERVWPSQMHMVTKSGPVRERALSLCRLPNLFGILSEPVAHLTSTDQYPAIILLNAGSAYHAGPNRLHVLLARRLAAAGFRCLRMDLHGLGDSVTPNPNLENETYPATAFRDIDLAMNFLETEIGARQTVLMGLCSGADAAFQSAVRFANPTLSESIMINPLNFSWEDGMLVESVQSLESTACQHSESSALNSGLACIDSGASAFPPPRSKNDWVSDLACTVGAKTLLTFFFSRSDPGYDILTSFAKRSVDEMCRTGQMRICFIEEADHTFTRRERRELLLDAIINHLFHRYRNAAAFGPEIFAASNRGL